MEAKSMFWGLILKPDKRYEQTVEEAFHVSKACLEPSTAEGGKVTTVFLENDSEEFIICNMKGSLSENLDLTFSFGEKICFRVEGSATVHLTGYLAEDDDFGVEEEDDSMMMGDSMLEEEAEESDEEEETPKLVKKRKHAAANGTSPAEGQEKKKKKFEQSALDKLVEEAKKSKVKEVKQAQSARASLLAAGKKKAGLQNDVEMDDEDSDEDEEDDIEDSDEGEEEEGDEELEEGEEEEDEDEEEEVVTKPKPGKKQENASPTKSPGRQTPASNKKDKKKGQPTATQNGTPVPKKPLPATPKGKVDQETPGSKKKGADSKANGANEGQKTPKRTLKGGLMVEDLKVGNGPDATPGKFVGMYYEGKLKEGGKTFDSCKQGKPFKFKLGKGEVIKGWDVGVAGMKVGGKRRLTVPPKLAYGSEGAPPDIPANAVLVFDVECKSVN